MVSNLLADTLAVAVAIAAWDLEEKGGPTDDDIRQASAFADIIGSEGDQILYRDRNTASNFARLAEAIAVLAFCPGGVTVFGFHWHRTIAPPSRDACDLCAEEMSI